MNSNPRDYQYIFEATNNEDTARLKKNTVSLVLQSWNKKTLTEMLHLLETFIVSSNLQNIKNLSLLIKCYPNISGGAISNSFKEDIYSKTSIIRITNDGNECFWWSLTLLLNQNSTFYKQMTHLARPKKLNDMAKQYCACCCLDYSQPVEINAIPKIIEQISNVKSLVSAFNIIILDINNLPAFNTTIDITPSIMFQTHFKTDNYFYLLYDNKHFSPIMNIKQFLNVRGFCRPCQMAFTNTKGFTDHTCNLCDENDASDEECDDDDDDDENPKIKRNSVNKICQIKTKVIGNLRKDRKLFLGSKYTKEAQSKKKLGFFRFIIWDIESTQEPDEYGLKTHKPNLIVAFEIIIKHGVIHAVEPYVDTLKPIIFEGYDCVENYCQWVLSEESNVKQRTDCRGFKSTTCIAHNSRGYDSRFILKYLDSKSLMPQTIRANAGSSIQSISIKNGKIMWIDSLNFFNQPLSKLPQTYGILNSVKGYFPHGFNTLANQSYIGPIPDIKYYHPEFTKIVNHKGKLDFSEHQN
jgi:hypothetical protein